MLEREKILAMAPQLIDEEVLGLAIVGSYARGDATPYSDINVISLMKPELKIPEEPRIDLYQGKYRVLQYRTEAQMKESLVLPERAIYEVRGLQQMLILFDPENILHGLQEAAHAFVWDQNMIEQADKYLNKEMILWQEECYKAMSGMRFYQEGQMLLGLYGLTYGLVRLMLIAKGILLQSENAFFDELTQAYSQDQEGIELVEMMGLAFGLDDGFPLLERVEVGLLLYLQFADYLDERLKPEIREQVLKVQERLEDILQRPIVLQNKGVKK